MPNFSREQRLAFAVGIPVAALLLFLWFRRRRGSFNATDDANEAVEENEFASGCETTIEVKMPQTAVGAVIGKGGANVKRIRKETGVRLDMVDEKDNVQATQGTRTMLVRGEREKAKRAELMLLKIIQEQPVILTEEVFVPQSACGRIIGKGGQNIRDIGRVSGAKIAIDRTEDRRSGRGVLRSCQIIGTAEQIRDAKGLLNEKIAEDKEMRAKMAANKYSAVAFSQVQLPSGDISFFKAFVSAMENPGHFWVQPITSDSSALEKLTTDLNHLYGSSAGHAVLNSYSVGDLCCAPFQFDNHWYRAEVLEIFQDGMVDLYYVDYGDTGKVAKENLRELRDEHLRLPFQAVECTLAGVQPTGSGWSDEACDTFEQLTHCAKWNVIMAKVIKYCDSMPCLELVDTSSQKDLNINEEMVNLGYGLHVADFPLSAPPGPRSKNISGPVEDASGVRADAERQEAEVAPQRISEVQQLPQNADMSCLPPEPGAEEADASPDTTDSGLRGPVPPERDSPVKTALLKRTSRDYINVPAQAADVLADTPAATWSRAHVSVLREEVEQGMESSLAKQQQPDARSNEPIAADVAKASKLHVARNSSGGQPSHQVTYAREHFVSSVTFVPHGGQHGSRKVQPSTPAGPAAEEPSQRFRVTRGVARQQDKTYAVKSVTQHVTEQTNVMRVERESPSVMSAYKVTFEQTDGNFAAPEPEGSLGDSREPTTATEDREPVPESTMGYQGMAAARDSAEGGDMSPSGSLLNISSNTVIDEEDEEAEDEEAEDEEAEDEPVQGEQHQHQGNASASDESDLESFVSTRDDVSSDTDTAGYVTACVGSSSASQEYLSVDTDTDTLDFESAREDATPVNTDDEEDGRPGTPTAGRSTLNDWEPASQLGRLDAQTLVLDAAVTSTNELGYRADSEEGLATEDAQQDTKM